MFGSVQLNNDATTTDDNKRMFFDKSKGAFRAGYAYGSQWDDANVGGNSIAMGSNVMASGNYSTAMGSGSTASGESSIAIGTSSTASKYYSIAMGYYSTSSGQNSTAIGYNTIASGDNSTAMGSNSTASGSYSIAMGPQAKAEKLYSISIGQYTKTQGNNSTAMGYNTTAKSYAETVMGMSNTNYSAVSTSSFHDTDRLFTIGNGTPTAKSDALVVLKNGNTTLKGVLTLTDGASSYTLPNTDGTAGQVLQTDGNGTLSWATAGGGATSYAIGDFAHGGIVFWVDETGQHGLVCAKVDQSGSIIWKSGSVTEETYAKGDGIYAGKTNTAIIIAKVSTTTTNAARICNELQITEGSITYGDWYLPSLHELAIMWTNKNVINTTATENGGVNFGSGDYWSSTEKIDTFLAGRIFFGSTFLDTHHVFKNSLNSVRAIRAF